ncbi:MAG: 50S ribosomal protein L25/general stress protein Ctc [Candidatus Atribacteria bacterium]|nr:50S ribosomal protein L25/general stress protein Ctc [Candidatus Atribacteria bacterium]MCD6349825.1 50S ribosomal protein L25/general stress protein Ctc [Candidatus Atribacteria bacterium]
MSQKESILLNLEKRESTGKGAARKLRRTGWIPGTLYSRRSKEEGSIPVKVKETELRKVLHTPGIMHHLIELSINGEKQRGIIKDIQRNPLKDEIWHVDFYTVLGDQKISLSIPVVLKGEAKGVKEGGILEFVTQELEVECLPDAIPEAIEVDISNLEIGDSIHVGGIQPPEGVTITESAEEVVVSVIPPEVSAEEEATEEEEEEEAQPEVIKKGGEQEE